MKPKQKSKLNKMYEGILIAGAMLIVGVAAVFIISANYNLIYNEISVLTKIVTKMDLNSTVDFLRGET